MPTSGSLLNMLPSSPNLRIWETSCVYIKLLWLLNGALSSSLNCFLFVGYNVNPLPRVLPLIFCFCCFDRRFSVVALFDWFFYFRKSETNLCCNLESMVGCAPNLEFWLSVATNFGIELGFKPLIIPIDSVPKTFSWLFVSSNRWGARFLSGWICLPRWERWLGRYPLLSAVTRFNLILCALFISFSKSCGWNCDPVWLC